MTIHIPSVDGEPTEVPVEQQQLPEALPVLPLRETVAFPDRAPTPARIRLGRWSRNAPVFCPSHGAAR